jgi:hypothetical protein
MGRLGWSLVDPMGTHFHYKVRWVVGVGPTGIGGWVCEHRVKKFLVFFWQKRSPNCDFWYFIILPPYLLQKHMTGGPTTVYYSAVVLQRGVSSVVMAKCGRDQAPPKTRG